MPERSGSVLTIVGKRETDVAAADAIECLETWLAMAKSGEITSIAIAGIGPSKSLHGHSSWVDARLIGGVAVLQQMLIGHVAGQ